MCHLANVFRWCFKIDSDAKIQYGSQFESISTRNLFGRGTEQKNGKWSKAIEIVIFFVRTIGRYRNAPEYPSFLTKRKLWSEHNDDNIESIVDDFQHTRSTHNTNPYKYVLHIFVVFFHTRTKHGVASERISTAIRKRKNNPFKTQIFVGCLKYMKRNNNKDCSE